MSADNGGSAFPVVLPDGVSWDGGMTLRDYFIAHAPTNPWPIFAPTMPTKRPIPGPWKSDDGKMTYATSAAAERDCGDCYYCLNQEELDAWDADKKYQTYAQWPAYWADAMLKERAK